MKRPSLEIFIPAYNEERNIGLLILDLLEQDIQSASLKRITVVSDGSTDQTVQVVRHFQNALVRVLDMKERKGKAVRQNEYIAKTDTDILVILDADISVPASNYIQRLVTPIATQDVHMTSTVIEPMPARTFFESVLAVSMAMKRYLYYNYKSGNNIYNAYGISRAFARSFYRRLKFPMNEGEDMYSYLACIANGFRFKTVKTATAYYRLPATLSDHYKQSVRFFFAKRKMFDYFDRRLLAAEFSIPWKVRVISLVQGFPVALTHPIHVCWYGIVLAGSLVKSLAHTKRDLWNVQSSKSVKGALSR